MEGNPMSIISVLSRANFGTPEAKIEINFRKKRKNFEEISQHLVDYGLATETVMQMQEFTWYLTDREYLMCAGYDGRADLPAIRAQLIMDENLQWLSKRAGKTSWRDFGTPVRIVRNEIDHCSDIMLLEEFEAGERSRSRPAGMHASV